jgi:hypothetical protein
MHITAASKVVSKAKGVAKLWKNCYAPKFIDFKNYPNASLLKNATVKFDRKCNVYIDKDGWMHDTWLNNSKKNNPYKSIQDF